MAFLLATSRESVMSPSIKGGQYLRKASLSLPGQSDSAGALASLLLTVLTSLLRSPARWPRLWGDEGSSYSGQSADKVSHSPT